MKYVFVCVSVCLSACLCLVCLCVCTHVYIHIHMCAYGCNLLFISSLIVNLTSRLEVIEVELKQSRRVSSASVRATGDNGKPEVTPRHHRRWTASSDQRRWSSESVISLPDTQRGSFTWQMPFTLKCIGTFRYLFIMVILEVVI